MSQPAALSAVPVDIYFTVARDADGLPSLDHAGMPVLRTPDGQALDPRDAEAILDALPRDDLGRWRTLRSLDGVHRYHDGPSDRELVLDRFWYPEWRDSMAKPDYQFTGWYGHQEDAASYGVMHSTNDLDHAWQRWGGPGGRLGADAGADMHEGTAVTPEYGPRDHRTELHVPEGGRIRYIEAVGTPKESHMDGRFGSQAFRGGDAQVLVLGYDGDRCTVTHRRMNASISFDPRAQREAGSEYLDHPRDHVTQSAAPREKLREAVDDAEHREYEAIRRMAGTSPSDPAWHAARAARDQAREDQTNIWLRDARERKNQAMQAMLLARDPDQKDERARAEAAFWQADKDEQTLSRGMRTHP